MTDARFLFLLATLAIFSGGSANAAGSDRHDPCSFLTVDEIEAVMGRLSGPPYRAGDGATPRPNGFYCRYEAPDRRSIRLSVTWDGGKELIAMMGSVKAIVEVAGLKQLKLLDGTTVGGHWDQAAINQCCEFNALHGDQVVTVDIAGSRATITQAATLADAAIQRLNQPLEISGAAGLNTAQEHAMQRPKPRNVCDLLTRADAEAIVGISLLQAPQGTSSICHYSWPLNAQGLTYELNLMVTWQDGFSEMRTAKAAVENATSMLGMDKLQKQVAVDHDNGPWDEFSRSIIGISAVKGDVMVSVEGGPIQQNVQQAFVEKAIVNLGK